MKILLITQVFYPDTVSVSQHLTDLGKKLVDDGHEVTVFTSCYPYEEKTHRYPRQESFQGIKVERLQQSSFGKASMLKRLLDFLTFYFAISIKLLFIKREEYNVIVGTTSPPLLSFVAVALSKLKGIRFHYWVMDLQPELSISSGLIREDSVVARLLTRLGNYTIRNSDGIISLDRFMSDYLYSRGAKKSSVSTIAVWPVMDQTYNGSRMSNPFRIENTFGDK
jgi:hypothetical protein